ncbi:MAG: dihydroorotase [Bdellovibrionales bacterium GWA2_49_15]|nr:MAG: dihydroorotase [Bdellovibrionales bacterium GWA2_49_15]HAZ12003.1 dihydroorotase [Bdellovibrionales bacterium]
MTTEKYDVVLQGGTCVFPHSVGQADIGVANGKITSFRPNLQHAKKIINCAKLTIFPGVIDSQVHFREPGLTHKEDLESGSHAAALGGVTAFLEMPNTKPPTTTCAQVAEKVSLASNRAFSHFGFFIGATAHNLEELIAAENCPGCVGIKIFLGSSTGDLLLYDQKILCEIFRRTKLPIAIHSEDELRLKEREYIRNQATHARQHLEWRDVETALRSTKMILELARKCQRRIHVLHISSGEEMEVLRQYRDTATVELLPQHLTLHAPECYDRLGVYAQMNPPIRERHHQEALWRALSDGIVDIIGSDHAPHTKAEKERGYPHSPSGLPGVQTIFPIMLHHALDGKLSLLRLSKLLSENPANLYGLNYKGKIAIGYDADFSLADLESQSTVSVEQMASSCGHTPYDGMKLKGKVCMTILKGNVCMLDGVLADKPRGEPLFQGS